MWMVRQSARESIAVLQKWGLLTSCATFQRQGLLHTLLQTWECLYTTKHRTCVTQKLGDDRESSILCPACTRKQNWKKTRSTINEVAQRSDDVTSTALYSSYSPHEAKRDTADTPAYKKLLLPNYCVERECKTYSMGVSSQSNQAFCMLSKWLMCVYSWEMKTTTLVNWDGNHSTSSSKMLNISCLCDCRNAQIKSLFRRNTPHVAVHVCCLGDHELFTRRSWRVHQKS
jgi:hypothetical protein